MKNDHIKPNWDAFTGLFSIALGVIYGFLAYNMPRAAFGNPLDAIYFPLGIAVVAIIIGVLLLVKSDFKLSIVAYKELINEDADKKGDRKKILYTCLVSVVYALLFEHVGYVISTFVFMFSMLTITSGSNLWKRNIIISVLFACTVYFVFSTLLSISLPPLPFSE